MINDIYKQVPRIVSEGKSCSYCGSHMGYTKDQNAYAYTRDYKKKTVFTLKLYYCHKCRVAYYVQGSSFAYDDPDYRYRVSYFDAANYKKIDAIKLINSLPTDVIEIGEKPELEDDFLKENTVMELTDTVLKEYDAPYGTIGIFCYEMPDHPLDRLRTAFIVQGESRMRDKKIYAYGIDHEYSTIIQNALLDNDSEFSYQGVRRKLHYCYLGYNLRYHMIAIQKIKDFESASFDHPVDIYVYRGKGVQCRNQHHLEMVTANIISARNNIRQTLNVYYCCFCDEFFVNDNDYFDFCKVNGLPPLRLHYGANYFGSPYGSYYDNRREYSKLRLYGYYVSGDMADKSLYRKRLLEDLVDSGLMTKPEILLHLEYLTRDMSRFPDAVARWQSDYDHLSDYHVDRQRIVWGRLTTK